MKNFHKFFVFLIEIFSIFEKIAGKFSNGILSTTENWAFLDRFCFVSEYGKLEYEFRYPVSYAVQNMYLYYDTEDQWPAVYKTEKTCLEKEAVLRREFYQIVNLSTWSIDYLSLDPGCEIMMRDQVPWFRCMGHRRFISYRQRWWYIAIGNCNSTNGLYAEYNLQMTNGKNDDIWHFHFSADEFDILPTDIAFLIADVTLLSVAFAIAMVLRARQMFHFTYRLFLTSLSLESFGLLCHCIFYGDYSHNGMGVWPFKLSAELLRVSSVLVFLLLLILMAKGYTITRARLSRKGQWKIIIFMLLYALTYMAVFIYQARVFDPGEVLYIYESVPGYVLIGLRILSWIWFCYAISFTLVHYPEKRVFYMAFATVFSIWFWTGPCVTLAANFLIGKWMREKIVVGVENSIAFAGFAAFLFITRPSAANKNFPFHIRTTQIDAMINKEADDSRSINLPHNAYEVVDYEVFTISSETPSPENPKAENSNFQNPKAENSNFQNPKNEISNFQSPKVEISNFQNPKVESPVEEMNSPRVRIHKIYENGASK